MSDSVIETFDQLVRQRPMPELIAFLLQLDKQDQVAVRLKTKELYKEVSDWRNDSTEAKKLRNRTTALFLAGLATYSKQEAMGRNFELPWGIDLDNSKDNRGYKQHFMTVVRHSRPAWLTDWLLRLTRTNPWSLGYGQLRELEAEGLVSYDPWLAAQLLGNRLNRYTYAEKERSQSLAAYVLTQLQTDATLLARDLPLLFDYDTPVDSAAIYQDKNRAPITWLTLLPELVASGHLDRADLLTRCLLALRRDFRRPLLTWFKNLFSSFNPTPAERLARQSELTELLAHPLPLVVNFALDQLKDLWADPSFEPALLLRYADGLLTRQDLKTGLKTLLTGFGKLLKVSPNLAPTLASLYAAALAQADATVQERAAKGLAELLSAKKPLLTPAQAADVAAAIPTYADLLAPPARAVLAPWLHTNDSTDINSITSVTYEPATDFAPDLSAATAIAPVADWHELLFLTGQVLQYDDPAAFERWLDGLLRLRGQFPAGYAQQLRPYLQQAFQWELQDKTEAQQALTLLHYQFGGNHVGQTDFIRALLASWFADFEHPRLAKINLTNQPHNHPDPLLTLERRRLATAEARLHPAAAPPLPLLSTPSHTPHWVAPTALVTRLLAHEATGLVPDPTDLVLALARTAFAAEADAAAARLLLPQLAHAELRALLTWFLAPAAEVAPVPLPAKPATRPASQLLAGLVGRLLSFKGSPTPAGPLAEALPWLWAVAARTRHPAAHLPELRPLADYPGVAAPWLPAWYFEPKSRTYNYSWSKEPPVTETWTELTVATEHPGQQPPAPLALYALHARLPQDKQYYLWSLGASLPFLLALLPNNPDPLHWHLLRTACRTDGTGSEARNAVERVLATLLAAGPRFPESTTTLLAVGLTHAAPTCRALAREVVLAAVAQRRLVPATLGAALGRLLAAGFVPAQRLADGLADLRAIDAATDEVLTLTLAALLPALPAEPPRNTRKLLDAYADLVGRTRQPVPPPVQARLREWQATASLKKTAAALLA